MVGTWSQHSSRQRHDLGEGTRLRGVHAVQGTIPVEWNKLANPLVTLDLSDNNLTGVLQRSSHACLRGAMLDLPCL